MNRIDLTERGRAMLQQELQKKFLHLKGLIAPLPEAAVAFSGGVDSTLLLYTCLEVLGPENVTALTACSPLVPRQELRETLNLALSLGALRHLQVDTPDLEGSPFRNNPRDRCYHCKKIILSSFLEVLGKEKRKGEGILEDGPGDRTGPKLLEGTNRDDLGAYRPGMQAVQELGVGSPLLEAGLGKREIRVLSREMDLPNWDMPSQACLASRIPYGKTVDREKLLQVEKGEFYLKNLGFRECRLRHHGALARLEVPKQDLARLLSLSSEVSKKIKALGFTHVTLDLEGLRSGSFD